MKLKIQKDNFKKIFSKCLFFYLFLIRYPLFSQPSEKGPNAFSFRCECLYVSQLNIFQSLILITKYYTRDQIHQACLSIMITGIHVSQTLD